MTNKIDDGSRVTLHYTGKLDDGSTFDSSHDREEPMTVTVGSGMLIEGFNNALVGMDEGDTKTFTLPPGEAYGELDKDISNTKLSKNIFPDDFSFAEGQTIPLQGTDNQTFMSRVVDFDDDSVIVDLNHPLAGKNLTFEVEVLSVDNDEIISS
tara:strand:+ start:3119 stop:3577 length:459 start_codon:yes stop_codon:yes gene_type:complete